MPTLRHPVLNATVLVVALGYFVDILDLTLFGMVRIQSLKDLGLSGDDLVTKGMTLLNVQMLGMLIGGVLWGQLADRRGRLSIMFYSIALYSIANLVNAFIQTYPQYLLMRFLAGIGLAGELGVGITLVAELLPKDQRGMGTTLVATIGVLGAVFGGVLTETFSWRVCFFIGGILGLLLLLWRFRLLDSPLFAKVHSTPVLHRGSLLRALSFPNIFIRFLSVILIGIPIWFVAGIVMTFSPELSQQIGIVGEITASRSIAISYLGLGFGDFASGYLSQRLRSRKKALIIFELLTIALLFWMYFGSVGRDAQYFYTLCFFIGFGAGFWALFVTVGAENFGTNIRATMATSIPNFVRASVIPINFAVLYLQSLGGFAFWQATGLVGLAVFTMSIISTIFLRETYHVDLDYMDGQEIRSV